MTALNSITLSSRILTKRPVSTPISSIYSFSIVDSSIISWFQFTSLSQKCSIFLSSRHCYRDYITWAAFSVCWRNIISFLIFSYSRWKHSSLLREKITLFYSSGCLSLILFFLESYHRPFNPCNYLSNASMKRKSMSLKVAFVRYFSRYASIVGSMPNNIY